MTRATLCALLLGSVFLGAAALAAPGTPGRGDWPTMNHDPGATRYSPLTQITPANVANLKMAWTYHMRPPNYVFAGRGGRGGGPDPNRYAGSEATPLVVNGLMFVPTPYNRVVALDAVTGAQKWAFQLDNRDNPAARGIEYWPGDAAHGPRLVVATNQGRILALDALTGAPSKGFGTGGYLDTKTPEIMNGLPNASYGYGAPAIVWRNIFITGSKTQESPVKGASGDVRAWDVVTGKLLWTFHSIPRPGEFGHDTWEGDSWVQRSGVNVWNMLTVDAARGVVYLPFGAPTLDRVGVDRLGNNLFANSVVAVDIRTGKRLWHYQMVHHDIWDHDTPVSPVLIDVKHGAKTIPGLAVMNKSAILFLLDRTTGQPIYEVRETPVPATSPAPGERPSPTQPIPVDPAFALGRDAYAPSDLAQITPEHTAACQQLIDSQKAVPSIRFQPLGYIIPTIRFPGSGGGGNWGGGAFDPKLGYYMINITNLGSIEAVIQRSDGSWGTNTGFFRDRETRSPCQTPPWGEMVAFNVNTGKVAWRSLLGVSDNFPEGKRDTGRPNVGGPIVTAGGLTFIGSTDDYRFRAFDSRTGKIAWETRLPASAHTSPITYQGRNGKQYVTVISTGGSAYLGSPIIADQVITYALP